jgi:hypothetical protein
MAREDLRMEQSDKILQYAIDLDDSAFVPIVRIMLRPCASVHVVDARFLNSRQLFERSKGAWVAKRY